MLERLGPDQGVFYPDDLVLAPDGTLYWTDIVLGHVGRLTPSGESDIIAEDIASANPITLSEDGRLFVAQCFETASTNSLFELDPTGVAPPQPLVTGVPACASNAMDWRDGALYSPRWFEDRIVRTDVATGETTEITTGWPNPAAVKFDSSGRLHGISHATGEVVRIDLETGQRTVLATLPEGLDNLAFDSSDRLFVSSATDASIVEVLEDGTTRTVSPGGLSTPIGMSLLGDALYVGDGNALRSFDPSTGEALDTTRQIVGVGPFPGIVASVRGYGDELLVLDLATGEAGLFDPATRAVEHVDPFALPMDAEPFMGGMAISDIGTGGVVLATGSLLASREILASGLTAPAGLAADGDDLYVSDAGQGYVLRIVEDGVTLAEPVPINDTRLTQPEGLVVRSDGQLAVVDGATGELVQIDIRSGQVSTLVSGMDFLPAISGFPYHFLNDVEIGADQTLYVNGDAAGVMYAITP
ncbi:MAG: hypothetical protein AAGC55_01975 [Myxococcota bacterium]